MATLPDAKAESVRKALTEALKYLPAELRKRSLLTMNARCQKHKILEEDLGIDVALLTHIHLGKKAHAKISMV